MDPDLPIHQSPVEELPPTPSFVHPKTFPFKWLMVILTVVFVVAVPSVYFLNQQLASKMAKKTRVPSASKTTASSPTITPTPDETASWKSFTSQKYGFSLKYPSDLTASEHLTPFYYIEIKRTNAVAGEHSFYEILASPDTFVAKDPAAYDWLSADMVDSFSAMQLNTTKQIATIIFTKKPDTTVAGMTATVINVKTTDDNSDQYRVFVKNGGNMYMFVNNLSGDQADFNNFLSSVKFISQTSQTGETASWKTYTTEDFSLKLPTGWTGKQTFNSPGVPETHVISSGKNGRSELNITKEYNNDKPISEKIMGWPSETPQQKNLTLGTTTGIEYHGCFGVEGCVEEYNVYVQKGNFYYVFSFMTYPDDEDVYHKIIDTLKFN